MLEHLFGSKTRVKLLRLFFREQDRSFFVRELSRELDVQINAVRRELELLLKLGIIREEHVESKNTLAEAGETLRKYYHINTESMLYSELQALLTKEKLLGQEELVKKLEHSIGDVKVLILTGRFVGDQHTTTDLLIVGEVKPRTLETIIVEFEKDFGFEIRYTIMNEQEFHDRRYVIDKFLFAIFEGEHIKVVNKLGV